MYFLSICFLLTACGTFAQRGVGKITITPSTFTVEDEVTVNIDVTGTDMAGQSGVYMWIFGDGGDGATNGTWTESKEEAKFTSLGNNVYQFKFTPVLMWPNAVPGNLKKFSFLTKTKNGSKQTDNAPEYFFDPLVFVESTYFSFPDKVGQDDVVTLYFNQNLSTDITEQRMTPTGITITALNEAGNAVGSTLTGTLKNEGGKKYSFILIPVRSFGVTTGGIKKLRYTITGTGKNESGATVPVSGVQQEKTLLDVK